LTLRWHSAEFDSIHCEAQKTYILDICL